MQFIMSRIFKTRKERTDASRPVSPTQSSSGSAMQPEKPGDDKLIDWLVTLSKTNGINSVQHGVRLAVIGELLVSVLRHLPDSMRANVIASFRDRVEDLMSLADDKILPEQYHSALLTEVNRYLNALR